MRKLSSVDEFITSAIAITIFVISVFLFIDICLGKELNLIKIICYGIVGFTPFPIKPKAHNQIFEYILRGVVFYFFMDAFLDIKITIGDYLVFSGMVFVFGLITTILPFAIFSSYINPQDNSSRIMVKVLRNIFIFDCLVQAFVFKYIYLGRFHNIVPDSRILFIYILIFKLPESIISYIDTKARTPPDQD